MKKKKWLCYLLSLCILGGCHRVKVDDTEEYEIRFRGNVYDLQQIGITSRAGFNAGDHVQLYIVEQDGTDLKLPTNDDFYQMLGDVDGNINFENGERHIYPINPINIYGFYLKGKEGSNENLTAMPVSVASEQTSEEKVLEADLLYVKSEKRHRASQEAIVLSFGHQFAKIQFRFKTDTPTTVDMDKLTLIEVPNVITEGSFDITTGTLTLGEASDNVNAQLTTEASVIVLPQKIAGGKTLFRFVQDEIERSYTVPDEGLLLEKGKVYTCNVLINQYPGAIEKDIVINTKIEDWIESEIPINIEIESGQDVLVRLADVVENVNIEKADLYLSSENRTYKVLNVPVVRNEMVFMFPRETKGGTLQLQKARFYTNDDEQFNYYFTERELMGDNLDILSLTPPNYGDSWNGGKIFIVGKVTGFDATKNVFITDVKGVNAYKGRSVAASSLSDRKMWCNSNAKGKSVLTGASHQYDGLENLEMIEKFIIENNESLNVYSAFQICVDLGEGWYLPALEETRWLVLHKDELGLTLPTGNLVTSTEDTKTTFSAIAPSTGKNASTNKSSSSYVIWPVCAY